MGLSTLLHLGINVYEAYDDGYFNNFLNGMGGGFPPGYGGGYPGYGMGPPQFGYGMQQGPYGYPYGGPQFRYY